MRRPLITDVSSMPIVSGTVSRPDRVAFAPPTICKNSGTMMLTLVNTVPTTKCVVTTMLNNRSRKRCSGQDWFGRAAFDPDERGQIDQEGAEALSILGEAHPSSRRTSGTA
jgi:hypothetical protein